MSSCVQDELVECGKCGRKTTVSVLDWKNGAPFLRSYIKGLLCQACDAETDANEERERLKERLHELIRHGKGILYLPRDFERYGFRESLEHMGTNEKVWEANAMWARIVGRNFTAGKRKENIWLAGPTGVGKTHLARCMMREVMLHGGTAAEVSCRRLAMASARFSDIATQAVERWKSTKLLVLDDLDKLPGGDFAFEALWDLLDARCVDYKFTIITANMGPNSLADHWSKRLSNYAVAGAALDRLKPYALWTMTGTSLRGVLG